MMKVVWVVIESFYWFEILKIVVFKCEKLNFDAEGIFGDLRRLLYTPPPAESEVELDVRNLFSPHIEKSEFPIA